MLHENVQHTLHELQRAFDFILKGNFIGTYIHGSYTLGGFHAGSDLDLLVVLKKPLSLQQKTALTKLLLHHSMRPFPIEISFLIAAQLQNWQHPCPFDYHFSEYWRSRYTLPFSSDIITYFEKEKTDRDLAAHITILHYCGICLTGRPIAQVFPTVPTNDYFDAIYSDYTDCLSMTNRPYSMLTMLRVYLFAKDRLIVSKQTAGLWGAKHLPSPFNAIAQKALTAYESAQPLHFSKYECVNWIQYIEQQISPYIQGVMNNDLH